MKILRVEHLYIYFYRLLFYYIMYIMYRAIRYVRTRIITNFRKFKHSSGHTENTLKGNRAKDQDVKKLYVKYLCIYFYIL